MAVAPYLVDTNILLRLSQPDSPYDAIVVAAIEQLVTDLCAP